MDAVFVDTNTLLNEQFNLSSYERVYVSIVSIEELDHLKRKPEIKYEARQAIRKIKDADNVEIKFGCSFSGATKFFEHGNDNTILSTAYDVCVTNDQCIFITDDFNLYIKARSLNIPCQMFEFNKNNDGLDIYSGYKEIILDEYEQATYYQCPINQWGLLTNEYLIIKDKNGNLIDKQRWTEKGFIPISARGYKSFYLGDFKPKDVYQIFAIDSLNNTDFTLLYGYAGTGKTQLALSYIMQNIASGKLDKAVLIFNPAKLRNNEQLGYYSGDRNQKLLQNSIGGILSSKLGDMMAVETLINQGKLMLIPTSDIRGIEISEKDCLYITEAQNTDSYTMRTIIQRAKHGCKIIVEGDMLEQQDIRNGSLNENGMIRVMDVFKGSKYFSCVKLVNTYRSPMAEIAQAI